MNTNNLWILALFFGMSIASWVIGQLREQAKLKRARDEARRQYEESLRTGRAAGEPRPAAQPAAPTPAELAERRQAQLRDLRRQQDASRGGTTVVVARPPTAQPPPGVPKPGSTPIVLGPGGIVIPRGNAPIRAKPVPPVRLPNRPPAPSSAPTSDDPRLAVQQRRLREQAEREAAMVIALQQEVEEERQVTRARLAHAQTVESAPPEVSLRGRNSAAAMGVRAMLFGSDGSPRRRDELRRLFALNEVLGRPLALREPGAS